MRKVSNNQHQRRKSPGLSRSILIQLRARWKLLYETEAPPHLSRDLLRRAVAYRMQGNVLGGLKAGTRRLLKRVAEAARPGAQADQSRANQESRY
jgi:Protein of unknown function (DUF2924)